MKKILIAVGVVIIAALAVAGYRVVKRDNPLVAKKNSSIQTNNPTGSNKVVKACDVVTQGDAEVLLGIGSKKADASTGDTASTNSIVSTCSYMQPSNLRTITLVVHAAKTEAGTVSNDAHFTTGLSATAQKISGYGDDAYWDPTYGQLNILAHTNWYVMSSGGLRPADKTLDEAKAFANLVKARL